MSSTRTPHKPSAEHKDNAKTSPEATINKGMALTPLAAADASLRHQDDSATEVEAQRKLVAALWFSNVAPFIKPHLPVRNFTWDAISHPTWSDEVLALCEKQFGQVLHPRFTAKAFYMPKHTQSTRHLVLPRAEVSHRDKCFVLNPEIDGIKWHLVDPVVKSTQDHENALQFAGWEWHKNSCATDAVLSLAIELCAWRIRADGLPSFRAPNLAVHWLRNVARMPWGLLTIDERTMLRDVLTELIAELNPFHPNPHEYRGIAETYESLFAELPQVTSHVVHDVSCCSATRWWRKVQSISAWSIRFRANKPAPGVDDVDWEAINIDDDGKEDAKEKTPAASQNMRSQRRPVDTDEEEEMQAEPLTLAAVLQNLFRPQKVSGFEQACGKRDGTRCGFAKQETILCGRLSPTIAVNVSNDNGPIDMKNPGLIPVTYRRIDGDIASADVVECQCNYEVEAIIYRIRGDHFVLESRINRDDKWRIDMMESGADKFRPSQSPNDWCVAGGEPQLIVYRKEIK